MNISQIGGTAAVTSTTNPFQQQRQDFAALQTALTNGNVSGAQSALSELQQLFAGSSSGALQSSSTSDSAGASSTTSTASPIQVDVSALSKALSNNNLNAAQTAFNQLKNDLKASHAGGHHHHGGGNISSLFSSSNPTTSNGLIADALSSSTGTQLNVTA